MSISEDIVNNPLVNLDIAIARIHLYSDLRQDKAVCAKILYNYAPEIAKLEKQINKLANQMAYNPDKKKEG